MDLNNENFTGVVVETSISLLMEIECVTDGLRVTSILRQFKEMAFLFDLHELNAVLDKAINLILESEHDLAHEILEKLLLKVGV